MKLILAVLIWVLSAIASDSLAQNPSDTPADVAAETRALNDGYSLRLIGAAAKARGEAVESYRLMLHHPDGSEDLVWNPPITEPNDNFDAPPGATYSVTLFRPDAGLVKEGFLGAVIGKGGRGTD